MMTFFTRFIEYVLIESRLLSSKYPVSMIHSGTLTLANESYIFPAHQLEWGDVLYE